MMNCDFSFESQGQIQNSPLPQPLPYMSLRLNKWFFYIVSAANMRSTSDRIFWEQASLVEIDINKSKIRHKALDRKVSQKIAIFFINNMFICCTRQHIYCKLTFHRDSICSLSSYKGDQGLCRASDMTTPTAMFRLAPNADTHYR